MIEVAQLYQIHAIELNPACFPLFSLLLEAGPQSTTDAARQLGVSHVAISKTARQLIAQELIDKQRSPDDERRSHLSLTAKGHQLARQAEPIWQGIRQALNEIEAQQSAPLLKALGEFEAELAQTSLVERVNQRLPTLITPDIEILNWHPDLKGDFERLVRLFLNIYFNDQLEPLDRQAIEQPEQYYLSQGGYIWFARCGGEIVGCCALKADGDRFELSKMIVHPDWQGRGIGRRILLHVIAKLRQLGAPKLWLGTHSKLKRAMALYLHLGFRVDKSGEPLHFNRADIRLILTLEEHR
jgi:DNA-binding MarR family transcriptional regulator/GNAT superfamily N-acetyltransferase